MKTKVRRFDGIGIYTRAFVCGIFLCSLDGPDPRGKDTDCGSHVICPGVYFGPPSWFPSSCIAANRSVCAGRDQCLNECTVHIHTSFREKGARGWSADYIFSAFHPNLRRQSHLSTSNKLSRLFLSILRKNFFNIFPRIPILILIEGNDFLWTNGPRFNSTIFYSSAHL